MHIAVVALAVSLVATPLKGEEAEQVEISGRLASMSDAEVDARLDYLVQTLDRRRKYSSLWWKGWTGFYALGVVVQSTQAGFENADGRQADLVVSAVKALGGTINLLRHPLAWSSGADAVLALPEETPADRRARLALAEATLRDNAESSDRRYWWFSHAMNVGINVTGAVIVDSGWNDTTRAWRSAGIGIAVGEIMLLSHPWWYRGDWNEYVRRFATALPKVSWHFVPSFEGVALHARF